MAFLPALALTEPFNSRTKCIQSSRYSSSFSRSPRGFSINACHLPLVGYPAPDFEVEAASDQKNGKPQAVLSLFFQELHHHHEGNFIINWPNFMLGASCAFQVKDSDYTRKPSHSPLSDNVRSIEKLLHLSNRSTSPIQRHENILSKPSLGISSSKKSLKIPEDAALPSSSFFQKTLYLESIGLDPFPLIDSHPPIISCTLSDLKSTVDFFRSHGFLPSDFGRIFTMCPEALTLPPSSILPVFTFLLREAKIDGHDLIPSINRRPRLLVSDVARRLRPTMYFLQTLGIADVSRHTSLLSCSVEDKFLPRLEFLQKIGFAYRDSVSMVRRFPQLFCLGIESNLRPKFNYFASEMGGQLEELKEFPQYFSFSLDCRIKPRHQLCADKGVYFSLPAMLRWSEKKFLERLELFRTSSQPRRDSPLWLSNQDV